MTWSTPLLLTQIRSCWSMARWNGARNDLHGSALSPSQTIRPLVRSPFGKIDELALLDAQYPDVAARRDDHPLHQPEPAAEGDALGRRQGFPVLSKTVIDLLP